MPDPKAKKEKRERRPSKTPKYRACTRTLPCSSASNRKNKIIPSLAPWTEKNKKARKHTPCFAQKSILPWS
ncbi:hypothetical protein VTJ04DRAFT_1572 [Mycothermus thermophilus]|uniref:uncharacterized protein n=1 Tax=Humicola insolens TaxID=85995 RepID=UPI0037431035